MAETNGETKSEGETVELVVKDRSGTEVWFRVRFQTTFEKIFEAYCTRKGVESNAFRFLYEGVRSTHPKPLQGLAWRLRTPLTPLLCRTVGICNDLSDNQWQFPAPHKTTLDIFTADRTICQTAIIGQADL